MDLKCLSDTPFIIVYNMLFITTWGLDERNKIFEGNKLIIYLTQPTLTARETH